MSPSVGLFRKQKVLDVIQAYKAEVFGNLRHFSIVLIKSRILWHS